MRIEQAIFGEVRGGHALRVASDASSVPVELASRLDLPDTAPPGVDWSPFISGFALADHYILARTFADPAATRAGMVLSHALIAPLKELIVISDLRPLFSKLIAYPVAPNTLESLEMVPTTGAPPIAADLASTAESLITRGMDPVVRVGVSEFEDLVVALWYRLWPELRTRFAFRLSFGPQDVVESPRPSLVCTPASLVARWTAHRIVAVSGQGSVSPAAAMLSGQSEAEPVLQFSRELGAELGRLSDLPILERVFELGHAKNPSFDECVSALRLVERLSPDPQRGGAGKARLVDALISRLPTATIDQVLLLRNLATGGLPTAHEIWARLEAWTSSMDFSPATDATMLAAISDALSTNAAVEPWRAAVLKGLGLASQAKTSTFPTAFWRWAELQPTVIPRLIEHVPKDRRVEDRLAESAPRQISRETGGVLMEVTASRKWLRLHGVAAGASLPPLDAVRRHLAIDSDAVNFVGVEAALSRATPAQTLSIALETGDPRIVTMAAKEAAKEPGLLKDINVAIPLAQDLWAQSVVLNKTAWRGPSDPSRSLFVVLEDLLNGKAVNSSLLEGLSTSPIADLGSYPRKADIWAHLAEPARRNFMNATATAWIKQTFAGAASYAPDHQLEVAILSSDKIDRELRSLSPDKTGIAIQVAATMLTFDEDRLAEFFGDWVSSSRAISVAEAEALGRLIVKRRWKKVLDELVSLAGRGRAEFKPALRMCSEMLDLWTRWSLGLSEPSSEDKWNILIEVAADLYPDGPKESELWERAGGRNADLRIYGSGRSLWQDAISQIKRGKGVSAADLLKEMSQDFPSNVQLRYLREDSKLGQ